MSAAAVDQAADAVDLAHDLDVLPVDAEARDIEQQVICISSPGELRCSYVLISFCPINGPEKNGLYVRLQSRFQH